MDRGRMIDHLQNINAKSFDKFASNRTSVRLMHPPGGKSTIQLGWDYQEPPAYQMEKNITPLQKKHINEMSSNGIYDCMKSQGVSQNYQLGNFKNEAYSKPQRYPQTQAFEIPINNYKKSPNHQPSKTPYKQSYGYDQMNKPVTQVIDNNQMGDYYPHHLTFSYNSNEVKQIQTPQKTNNSHKTYDTFLNEQLQTKETMSQGLPYEGGATQFKTNQPQQNYNNNYNTKRLSHINPQSNYHQTPSVYDNNYNQSNEHQNKNNQQEGMSNTMENNNNNDNWDSVFSRRKPAIQTKYEFIH